MPLLLPLAEQLSEARQEVKALRLQTEVLREEMVERLLVLAEQRTQVEQLQQAAREQQELLLETLSELRPSAEEQVSRMLGLPTP